MNPTPDESTRDHQLEEILHQHLQKVDAGESQDRNSLLKKYPEFASELAAFFASQDAVSRMARGMAEPAAFAENAAEAPTLAPNNSPMSSAGPRIHYFGDYELLEEIAHGGMGVVFKARQVSLDRLVALKMIRSGQLASPDDVRRFRTEAESAANLDHPHIVPIYEVGEHDGQQYFSMKLMEGGTSRERSAACNKSHARQLNCCRPSLKPSVTHISAGILHRDLKPANILLDGQGKPHVTDFGLAKRVEGDQGLTQSGAIVGTPSYMPPEQAAGKKGLTTAVDVYSLGAIMYELLTGQPPFKAETPLDTVLEVLEKEPEAPRKLNPAIDRDLETICLKCLEKEPSKRYGSAEALAEELLRWLRGEPILARPVGSGERLWRWCRRNRPIAAALAGLLVSLLAGTLVASVLAVAASRSAGARRRVLNGRT